MIITWGKPKIEYAKTVEEGTEPTVYKEMPTQEEDSVQLTTNPATAKELFGEGHELVARQELKPTYVLTMDVFIDKGDDRPIETVDGVIDDTYAVKLTPEAAGGKGFLFKSSQVSAEELWSSAKGSVVRYTFTALKPKAGNTFTAGDTW